MNIHDFAGLRNISNREVYHGADQLRLVACELREPAYWKWKYPWEPPGVVRGPFSVPEYADLVKSTLHKYLQILPPTVQLPPTHTNAHTLSYHSCLLFPSLISPASRRRSPRRSRRVSLSPSRARSLRPSHP